MSSFHTGAMPLTNLLWCRRYDALFDEFYDDFLAQKQSEYEDEGTRGYDLNALERRQCASSALIECFLPLLNRSLNVPAETDPGLGSIVEQFIAAKDLKGPRLTAFK